MFVSSEVHVVFAKCTSVFPTLVWASRQLGPVCPSLYIVTSDAHKAYFAMKDGSVEIRVTETRDCTGCNKKSTHPVLPLYFWSYARLSRNK